MKKRILTIATADLLILASIVCVFGKVAYCSKRIKIDKKKLVMEVGEKASVKTNTKAKVKWISKNKKIASVTAKGVVLAKKVGKTKILAKYSGQKAVCDVRVRKCDKSSKTSRKDVKDTTNLTPPTSQSLEIISVTTNNQTIANSPTPTARQIQTPAPAPDIYVIPAISPVPGNESRNNATPYPEAKGTQEEYRLNVDIWLLFGLDQDKITTQTKLLSGTMVAHDNTAFCVSVNNKTVYNEVLDKNSSKFSVDVDLSDCKPGDKIVISRKYMGQSITKTENMTKAVYNQSHTYTIE